MEEFTSKFFDESSEAWRKNKVKTSIMEGVFEYRCAEICQNGKRCINKPYSFMDEEKNKKYIKYLGMDENNMYCKLHCEKRVKNIMMNNLQKKRKLK